jgi:hypothetical protein
VGEAGTIQATLEDARGPTDAREEAGSEESGSTEAVVTRSAGAGDSAGPSSFDRSPASSPSAETQPMRLTKTDNRSIAM